MKFSKILMLLLVTVPSLTFAQKIKYKDLFPQLNAKNYTPENEKTLRAFLSEQKKPHANGNLQLAYILEKQFYEIDILSDTVKMDMAADSAMIQLAKAKELIDEKELKKNDELYQSFYRRDLRTGDFGIKISDVHLDLEKKVELIEQRKVDIRKFNTLLHRIDGRNKLGASIYKQTIEKAPTKKELLFLLTEEDMDLMDQVIANANGLYVLNDDLKESAKALGSDYYQGFEVFKTIETYGVDGLEQADVYSGTLDMWDYETWAKSIQDEYFDVKEYKATISSKEAALNQAFDQVAQGSDPGDLSFEDITANANEIDPGGSAVDLLTVRSSQLEVNRLSSPAINPALGDSMNIYAQLEAASLIIEELGGMTTIYSDLSTPEKISLATNRYPKILEEYYGGSAGYSEFIQNLGNWINDQETIWSTLKDSLAVKERYAISAEDTIALFVNEEIGRYMTKVVHGESTKMAAGIDTVGRKGFVVFSGPSRTVDLKHEIQLDSMNFDSLQAELLPTPTRGFYFFDASSEENNLFILATSDSGEIKWSNRVTAPNEPTSFRYDETLDQLTVFFFPEDQLPGEGVTAYVVIDRNGTVR